MSIDHYLSVIYVVNYIYDAALVTELFVLSELPWGRFSAFPFELDKDHMTVGRDEYLVRDKHMPW